MKIVFLIPLISIVCAVECHAVEAQAPQKFVGKFAFNWFADPAKQRCQLVTAAFASNLAAKHFSCALDKVSNDFGLKPIRCGDPGEKAEYLLFDTNKDCENERGNQAVAE